MKKLHSRILSLLLTLGLIWGNILPVQAYQEDASCKSLAPLSCDIVVSQHLNVAGPKPGDDRDYVTTVEEAAALVREGIENRQETVTVAYLASSYDESIMQQVLDAALEHTGVPTQGDYLRWQMGKCYMSASGYSSGDKYYLTLSYAPEYYTTAQQEAELDLAVEALLDELALDTATDYEKICGIYDYICENVVYDEAGLAAKESDLIYTAYAALINGTSVCQGYANLFYRLALELGVDARLISGEGDNEPHGWNIVKLNGKYYNVDATWDSPRKQANVDYQYFLRCEENFEEHIRDSQYATAAFHAAYPMGTKDYSLPTEALPGDVNGDDAVTRDDAIRVLLYVLNPTRFPMDADADFNGDNVVTRDDAIRLLLYVLNPNRFPLEMQ